VAVHFTWSDPSWRRSKTPSDEVAAFHCRGDGETELCCRCRQFDAVRGELRQLAEEGVGGREVIASSDPSRRTPYDRARVRTVLVTSRRKRPRTASPTY
jgi:hypothetical protein